MNTCLLYKYALRYFLTKKIKFRDWFQSFDRVEKYKWELELESQPRKINRTNDQWINWIHHVVGKSCWNFRLYVVKFLIFSPTITSTSKLMAWQNSTAVFPKRASWIISIVCSFRTEIIVFSTFHMHADAMHSNTNVSYKSLWRLIIRSAYIIKRTLRITNDRI